MTRGTPLEGAPGWRVIERSQPRRRRASVTILAIAAGLLLVFAITYRYRAGWPEDHHPQVAPPALATAPRPAAPTAQGPIGQRSEPERAVTEEREPEAMATPAPSVPPAATASPRIFIHYPAHHGDAVPAIRLAALLQSRGYDVADIRLVNLEIEEPSVRYFFAADRAGSQRLVDAISALLPQAAPDEATDFSHFSPKPRPGTVELWLPAAGPGPMAQDSSS